MGAVEGIAVNGANSLLNQGAIGILALFGWLASVIMGFALVAMWRALRASEAARVKDLQDAVASAEKERAEQDVKMDRLQAILEATKVRR